MATRPQRGYLLTCLVLLASLLLPCSAYADLSSEARAKIHAIRRQSQEDKQGKTEEERRAINRQERAEIDAIRDEFDDQQPDDDEIPGRRAGQTFINGFSSTTTFDLGEQVTVTFRFIDLDTGAIIGGPTIGSVVYEVNLDPFDEFNFLPIGVGTDSSSAFAISFTIVDFEPFVRGTPFDPAGAPIVISGLGDENIAIGELTNVGPVPEPASVLLLSCGLVAFVAFAVRRRFALLRFAGTRP